ncbi:hypothetical protein V1478_017098 [Vespula squamosa]|uniref:Uncharacterized protein n=1 Tax=Vespula squamosa TaxID=30214 RepID=A0ABD1ZYE6_VESSQ
MRGGDGGGGGGGGGGWELSYPQINNGAPVVRLRLRDITMRVLETNGHLVHLLPPYRLNRKCSRYRGMVQTLEKT